MTDREQQAQDQVESLIEQIESHRVDMVACGDSGCRRLSPIYIEGPEWERIKQGSPGTQGRAGQKSTGFNSEASGQRYTQSREIE